MYSLLSWSIYSFFYISIINWLLNDRCYYSAQASPISFTCPILYYLEIIIYKAFHFRCALQSWNSIVYKGSRNLNPYTFVLQGIIKIWVWQLKAYNGRNNKIRWLNVLSCIYNFASFAKLAFSRVQLCLLLLEWMVVWWCKFVITRNIVLVMFHIQPFDRSCKICLEEEVCMKKESRANLTLVKMVICLHLY